MRIIRRLRAGCELLRTDHPTLERRVFKLVVDAGREVVLWRHADKGDWYSAGGTIEQLAAPVAGSEWTVHLDSRAKPRLTFEDGYRSGYSDAIARIERDSKRMRERLEGK